MREAVERLSPPSAAVLLSERDSKSETKKMRSETVSASNCEYSENGLVMLRKLPAANRNGWIEGAWIDFFALTQATQGALRACSPIVA